MYDGKIILENFRTSLKFMNFLENFLVNFSDFVIEKEIGEGNFSSVFLVHPKNQKNIKIAAKRIPVDLDDHDTQKFFIREISIMAILNHPNLIKFVGFSIPTKNDQNFYIYSEFIPNKTLLDVLKNDELANDDEKILDATKRSKIVYGIASAMAHLHQYKIVHRDLKPENIFLDENFNPILADFGLSRFYDDDITMTSRLGTPYYMSPELFNDDNEITNKIDVYAFGITLLSLFTTNFKFSKNQPRSINQLVNYILSGKRYVIPKDVPEFYVSLIQKCWANDQKERPSFDEIVKELDENDEFLFEGADKNEVNTYIKRNSAFISSEDNDDEKDLFDESKDYEETEEFDFLC